MKSVQALIRKNAYCMYMIINLLEMCDFGWMFLRPAVIISYMHVENYLEHNIWYV